MKQIDMVKAFAELEGFDTEMHGGCVHVKDPTGLLMISSITYKKYNPITDLALNCTARDKYHIYIDYQNRMAVDYLPDFQESFLAVGYGCMILNRSIGYAVIECILKSKGKWNEH